MPRNSRRNSSKRTVEQTTKEDINKRNSPKQRNTDGTAANKILELSDPNDKETPLSTEKAKRIKFVLERPENTYKDNENSNASIEHNSEGVKTTREDGIIPDGVELRVMDDDFPSAEKLVKKRNRSTTKSPAVSAKKRRDDQRDETINKDNNSLSEQMEKLVRELAQVKEQLKEQQCAKKSPGRGTPNLQSPKNKFNKLVKSPSVETIYVPAVRRASDIPVAGVIAAKMDRSNDITTPEIDLPEPSENDGNYLENCLNKFLAQIRLGTTGEQQQKDVHR